MVLQNAPVGQAVKIMEGLCQIFAVDRKTVLHPLLPLRGQDAAAMKQPQHPQPVCGTQPGFQTAPSAGAALLGQGNTADPVIHQFRKGIGIDGLPCIEPRLCQIDETGVAVHGVHPFRVSKGNQRPVNGGNLGTKGNGRADTLHLPMVPEGENMLTDFVCDLQRMGTGLGILCSTSLCRSGGVRAPESALTHCTHLLLPVGIPMGGQAGQ